MQIVIIFFVVLVLVYLFSTYWYVALPLTALAVVVLVRYVRKNKGNLQTKSLAVNTRTIPQHSRNTVPKSDPRIPKRGVYSFQVVGVSFNNDDGTSRQEYLSKIKNNERPFDKRQEIQLYEYKYERKRAFLVLVEGKPVGHVPADKVSRVNQLAPHVKNAEIEVYGGYGDKYFGAEVSLFFEKQQPPV